MTKQSFLTLVILLSGIQLFAQQGIIRGKVKEAATQEGLPFATVQIAGTASGTVTDFDGNFNLPLPAGTYEIEISFIGYVPVQITGIEVPADEVIVLNASLEEETEMLEAVVVTAEQINNTEAALLNVQRKSANLLDGISAQNFKKIGDSNIAGAIKRVPGVSVSDGKYVYVRGLGDRYTKSILNGVDIPGLDPDRNTVQMDIFPTNLIDNILVVKTSTADLPADFTGGVVNIVTKDFPEYKEWSVSGSIGYNPNMHFNNNYYASPSGGLDALGIDDGTRDLPIKKRTEIPNPVLNDPLTAEYTSRFNTNLEAIRQTSFMNYNLGFTGGNQKDRGGYTLGYIMAVNYRNTTTFYEDNINTSYFKNEDTGVNDLRLNRIQEGDFGTNNVLLSGLGGVTLRTRNSKFNFNVMHLQNGESRAGYFYQRTIVENSVNLFKDNIEFSERSITNLMLSGEHANENADFIVEWKLSPTRSKIEDKDIRLTPYRIDGTNYSIEPSESGDPTRIWRNLDEVNLVGRTDFTKKMQLFGYESSLKFGVYSVVKQRDYEILNYRLVIEGTTFDFTGQANELMEDEFLWDPTSGIGSAIQGSFQQSNTFDATSLNAAAYISDEFRPAENLRMIVGLRMEKFDQWYTGVDQSNNDFDNEKILDMIDLFPSTNIIYSATERSNIRLSYSRTIARPSFKEASFAQIFDPLTGRTFIGGLRLARTIINGSQQVIWDGNLKETTIDNFDLRWESFQERAQMFAISGFFKNFQDPIELVVFSDNAPDNFQPRNVGNAIVYGTELELRRDLSFVSPGWDVLSFNVNTTLLKSIEEMDKTENGEYQSRLRNARDGEKIKDTRQLQGQAPYMVNAGLSYNGRNDGIQAGFFYNVQGRRLQVVGFGPSPDVFTEPFHSLNFNGSYTFGTEQNQKIGFGVTNLLADDIESRYDAYKSNDPIFSRVSPERRFTLRYSISF